MRDRRKIKNQVNYLHRKIRVGTYFIDCNGHPVLCTEKDYYSPSSYGRRDWYSSEVNGTSLISDNPSCPCSFLHCAPEPITKERALAMAEYRKTHTYCEYMVWMHPETTIEYWEMMDKEWNFSERDNPK